MATESYVLTAEVRERAGKGIARALRREDKIPAVITAVKKSLHQSQYQHMTCHLNITKVAS